MDIAAIEELQNTKDVRKTISLCGDVLNNSLNDHMVKSFYPDGSKALRTFAPQEVQYFTGVAQPTIRMYHAEMEIPHVDVLTGGRRAYHAEAMEFIRQIKVGTRRARPLRRNEDEKLQVISLINFKGGAAKTTSTIHLAQYFALKGYRVLAIDLDPQASLTSMFGLNPSLDHNLIPTIDQALRYDNPIPFDQVIRETYFPMLSLAPASLMLSEYETETALNIHQPHHVRFNERLTKLLDQPCVQDNFDLVLIDCPPQLGFTTLTGLMASTGIVVPVVPSMLDISSMAQFLTMLNSSIDVLTEHGTKQNFDFLRFLVTKLEPSDIPQTQMVAFLRSRFGKTVMDNSILKSTAIADAALTQQTAYEISPSQVGRKTLERIITSLNSVGEELEGIINAQWGRE